MLILVLTLACTAALKDDIADLEAELEDLESQVEELEDGDDDTAAPVDTGDSGADSEEPFEVPTVYYFYSVLGSHPNLSYMTTIQIAGDYDSKRTSVNYDGVYDELEGECSEYVSYTNLPSVFVEFWYNGTYDCWSSQAISQCNQIPFNVVELSCD